MIYYVAGVPYSDDLYHSGVKGMKWGVRRYQNYDRTLTPLGKIHYGASKAGRAVGKAAIATGKAVGQVAAATGREIGSVAKRAGAGIKRKIKSKHRWLMTEEDFKEYTNRLNMEASYEDAKKRANANKASTKFKEFLGKTLEKGATSFVDRTMTALGTKMGTNLGKSKNEKLKEKLDIEKLSNENKKSAYELESTRWKGNKETAENKKNYYKEIVKANEEQRNAEKYFKSINAANVAKAQKESLRKSRVSNMMRGMGYDINNNKNNTPTKEQERRRRVYNMMKGKPYK